MVSELQVNTTVMSGDLDSFKANFSRSVLGVTYRRHKKKRADFYEMRVHNEDITNKTFEFLFLNLKNKYGDKLSNFNIRITYTIKWDNNGKILEFKNIFVNLYLPWGSMTIDKLELIPREDMINIHFFYSDYDSGSQSIKKILEEILDEMGKDTFRLSMHNLNDEDYHEISELFEVTLIPFVRIDDFKIKEPTERKIRDAILRTLGKKIIATNIIHGEKQELKELVIELQQQTSN